MNAGIVHYIGDDPDFILEVKNYISSNKLKITFNSSLGNPIAVITESSPFIIYLDFTCLPDLKKCIQQVSFLKKIPQYRSVIFVALLKDEEDLKKYNYIFSSGFQFSFIKGGEIFTLLRDSFYFLSGDKRDFPHFAEAKSLFRKIKAGVCSAITELSPSSFTVETNLITTKTRINFKQDIFPNIEEAEIISDPTTACNYPMATSYELAFPSLDPWSDDPKNTVLPETVETWLDLHKDQLGAKQGSFVVIDPEFLLLQQVFDLESNSTMNAFYFAEINQLLDKLDKVRPSVIFIETSDKDDHPNSVPSIEQLVRNICRIEDYRPIIICSNMPSSSSAIQKFLSYPSVVCSPDRIGSGLIQTFIELYIKRKLQVPKENTPQLSFASEVRAMDLNFDIEVLRVTEHEISFRTEEEIPELTVLHFMQPIELYATLVPPLGNATENAQFKLKTAFIHGISEKKLEVLRQFVNLLIVNPELEFRIYDVDPAIQDATEKANKKDEKIV